MFPALKTLLLPLAVLSLILGSAIALQTPTARADLSGTADASDGVWFLESYGTGAACDTAGDPREVRLFGVGEVTKIERVSGSDDPLPVLQIASNDELIMCVEPAEADDNVVFDTTGGGEWNEARCTNLEDDCVDEEGVGDDALTVPGGASNTLSLIAITFSCNGASVQTLDITQDDANAGEGDEISFRIMCKGPADSLELTVTPGTVESDPAAYNTSHALIRGVVTDAAGNPVLPGAEVNISSDCGISVGAVDTLDERAEALFNEGTGTHDGLDLSSINAEFGIPPLPNFLDIIAFSDRDDTVVTQDAELLEVDTNAFPDDQDGGDGDGVPNHSEILVIFHAEGCAPGVHTVSFEIDSPGTSVDIEGSVDITVIGPPAFMTIAAAPTELVCGEKAEITVSVTDALNQPVSDNTRIEVITNFGGVLAGTGTSLYSGQPVNPLSSTTVEIYDGSGTAYLITSPEHHGPYEVLGASTPSQFGTGVQDYVPVTDQVTVTCTLFQQPDVTAPDTGTGQIRPPNTGDAGLATDAASTTLAVIAGAVAVTLAGMAKFGLARR
jgi:hypothetical protein